MSEQAQHAAAAKCRISKECEEINPTLHDSTLFTPFPLESQLQNQTFSTVLEGLAALA